MLKYRYYIFLKKYHFGSDSVAYFATRDLAVVTIFAALWGVLNVTVSPIVFQIFNIPFLCDIIGFAALILSVWWVRKFGTATFVGLIALIINMLIRPTALHFFGFFAASIIFDVLAFLSGYKLLEKKFLGSVSLFLISVFSAAVAGLIIGNFFMPPAALIQWGGVLGWSGLHAIGGIIGGAMGVSLTNALAARNITPKSESASKIWEEIRDS